MNISELGMLVEPSSPGRAALCVVALSQLNPYVQVNVGTTITENDLLSKDPTAHTLQRHYGTFTYHCDDYYPVTGQRELHHQGVVSSE